MCSACTAGQLPNAQGTPSLGECFLHHAALAPVYTVALLHLLLSRQPCFAWSTAANTVKIQDRNIMVEKITESDCRPSTTMPTQPCPEALRL